MAIRRGIKRMAEDVTPEFMGVDEAEILSGISRWTWRQYAYRGKVESTKVGARLLIPITEIRRILEEGRRPRTDGRAAGEPSAKLRHRDSSVIDATIGDRAHA